LNQSDAVVPKYDPARQVSVDVVALHFGKAGTAYYDTTPLVLADGVLSEMGGAVEHQHAIAVVVDLVALDPSKATL